MKIKGEKQMKKIGKFILIFLALYSFLVIPCYAAEPDDPNELAVLANSLAAEESKSGASKYKENIDKPEFRELVNSINPPTKDESVKPDEDVYISKYSPKYHRAGCEYLYVIPSKVSRSRAIEYGLANCPYCNPDGIYEYEPSFWETDLGEYIIISFILVAIWITHNNIIKKLLSYREELSIYVNSYDDLIMRVAKNRKNTFKAFIAMTVVHFIKADLFTILLAITSILLIALRILLLIIFAVSQYKHIKQRGSKALTVEDKVLYIVNFSNLLNIVTLGVVLFHFR